MKNNLLFAATLLVSGMVMTGCLNRNNSLPDNAIDTTDSTQTIQAVQDPAMQQIHEEMTAKEDVSPDAEELDNSDAMIEEVQ